MKTNEYNQYVQDYAQGIFRYACKILTDRYDAEDICQIVFEKLWVNREKVRTDNIKSYLFRITYTSCIDLIRKRKHQTALTEIHETKLNFVMPRSYDQELRESINKALDQLPEVQKSLILLRDYEGYSYKEIGEISELTEAQVKVYIFRGRKKLQALLKEVRYN